MLQKVLNIIIIVLFSGVEVTPQLYDKFIGNYSGVITDYSQCGITKTSNDTQNNCFKFHPDFYPRIIGAREVRLGDAPWTVGVATKLLGGGFFNCVGSLISSQWVLTAAHCLYKTTKSFRVHLSTKFSGEPWVETVNYHIWPEYNQKAKYGDIMLIKLNEPVQFNLKGQYYDRNLICLPDTNLMIGWKRLAHFSGWGMRNDWQRKDHQQLKIGELTVQAMDFGHNYYRLRLETRDDVMLCTGDSGGPVWMYYLGRAYQVGVLSTADPQNKTEDRNCGQGAYATYLPSYMDWIFETIKNN